MLGRWCSLSRLLLQRRRIELVMSADSYSYTWYAQLTAEHCLSGDECQPACDVDPSDKEALYRSAKCDEAHGDSDRTIDARQSFVESENA